METTITTESQVPAIILTTPLEYGYRLATEKGRKRISDELAMRYAHPDYWWEIRDLLEKKTFESIKELFSFFHFLYLSTTIQEAKYALKIGFIHSAEEREFFSSPYKFEFDNDFQYLYNNDILNVNKIDEIIKYFSTQNETNQQSNRSETMQTLPQQPTDKAKLTVGQKIQAENCYLIVTATKEKTDFDATANFANLNKTDTLGQYYSECSKGKYTNQRIKVKGKLSVNNSLFTELSNSLLSDWAIANLKEFGGTENVWQMSENDKKDWRPTYYFVCLEVSNVETNEIFYIDSQGCSYPRYVGLPENIDYSQKVEKIEVDKYEPKVEVKGDGNVFSFKNKKCFVTIDIAEKEVSGRCLVDTYNEPRFYNKTYRSIKKATAELLKRFDENTGMYDAARILAQYLDIRSYCAMD